MHSNIIYDNIFIFEKLLPQHLIILKNKEQCKKYNVQDEKDHNGSKLYFFDFP